VRPQLEYASRVWDKPVKRKAGKVETVQRSAVRLQTYIHQVSQPCYKNFSGVAFNSDEPVAESLCCIAPAMVCWLSLLQLTSNRLQTTPEGPKPNTVQHKRIQPYLLSYHNLPVELYWLTSASCRRTASSLNWTQLSWCECLPALFYPLYCTVFTIFPHCFCFAHATLELKCRLKFLLSGRLFLHIYVFNDIFWRLQVVKLYYLGPDVLDTFAKTYYVAEA